MMKLMTKYSKENRKYMTFYELEFKKKLQRKRIYFRSQKPCNKYIVDFLLPHYKLIIEIDGEYHNNIEQINKDNIRDKFFNNLGFKTIRIQNKDVLSAKSDMIIENILRLDKFDNYNIGLIFNAKF